VIDRSTNAKLKVSFFRPFWVITGSSISAPTTTTPWLATPAGLSVILGRKPTMDSTVYEGILGRLRAQGTKWRGLSVRRRTLTDRSSARWLAVCSHRATTRVPNENLLLFGGVGALDPDQRVLVMLAVGLLSSVATEWQKKPMMRRTSSSFN